MPLAFQSQSVTGPALCAPRPCAATRRSSRRNRSTEKHWKDINDAIRCDRVEDVTGGAIALVLSGPGGLAVSPTENFVALWEEAHNGKHPGRDRRLCVVSPRGGGAKVSQMCTHLPKGH